jgi:hypothetical protein
MKENTKGCRRQKEIEAQYRKTVKKQSPGNCGTKDATEMRGTTEGRDRKDQRCNEIGNRRSRKNMNNETPEGRNMDTPAREKHGC